VPEASTTVFEDALTEQGYHHARRALS